MSREHDQPIQPLRIPQLRPAQQDLIRSERDIAPSTTERKSSFVGVERVVGLFGAELTGEVGEGLGGEEVSG
jgi:hypothetical protein